MLWLQRFSKILNYLKDLKGGVRQAFDRWTQRTHSYFWTPIGAEKHHIGSNILPLLICPVAQCVLPLHCITRCAKRWSQVPHDAWPHLHGQSQPGLLMWTINSLKAPLLHSCVMSDKNCHCRSRFNYLSLLVKLIICPWNFNLIFWSWKWLHNLLTSIRSRAATSQLKKSISIMILLFQS